MFNLPQLNMSIIITDDCIHCGACEPECPNTAIYENGSPWFYADGTRLTQIELEDGSTQNADQLQDPISGGFQGANGDDYFYIVPSKCTECTGFHEEPACAIVCPTDACVPDPDYLETSQELLDKKNWLHNEAG